MWKVSMPHVSGTQNQQITGAAANVHEAANRLTDGDFQY